MMSLQLQTRQEKAPNRRAFTSRTQCPRCRSSNLLNEGMDQLCCDCDWDTCAEYVERGLMNNLNLAFREHFPKQVGQIKKQERGSAEAAQATLERIA